MITYVWCFVGNVLGWVLCFFVRFGSLFFFRLSADNGIVVGRKGGVYYLFIMMVENAFDKRQRYFVVDVSI